MEKTCHKAATFAALIMSFNILYSQPPTIIGFPLSIISSNAESDNLAFSAKTALGWHITKTKGWRAFSVFGIANAMKTKGEELAQTVHGTANITKALIEHFSKQGYALNESDIPIFSHHAVEPVINEDGLKLLQQLKKSGPKIIGISNHDTEEDHIYVQKIAQKTSVFLPAIFSRMIVIPYTDTPFTSHQEASYYHPDQLHIAQESYPSQSYLDAFRTAAKSIAENARLILVAHQEDRLPASHEGYPIESIRYATVKDLGQSLRNRNLLT